MLNNLVDLDVIPLLGSLQCLQVVTGRVVVDQFPPPLCYFLLQKGKDWRCIKNLTLLVSSSP